MVIQLIDSDLEKRYIVLLCKKFISILLIIYYETLFQSY